jgi:excisionase family DNA binding protein
MAAELEPWWGTQQVADYLGVPPSTVRYWAYMGTGPRSYKIGRRRKYKPSEVKAWCEAHADSPQPSSPSTSSSPRLRQQ